MKNLVIGAVVAAIVMFFWGFLFWGTPFPYNTFMERVADDTGLMQAMDEHLDESGVYYVPDLAEMGTETFNAKHEKGPLAFIFLRKDGGPAQDMSGMLFGFIHFLVTAFLLAFLIRWVMGCLNGLGSYITFGSFVGLIAGFYTHIGNVVWWKWPLGWQTYAMVYDITSFALGALLIGYFLRKNASQA